MLGNLEQSFWVLIPAMEGDSKVCEDSESLSLGSDAQQIQTVEISEKSRDIERKITSFGFFSEDLAAVLFGLLKDNEEMKRIIEDGFKELEMKQSESNKRTNDIEEKLNKGVCDQSEKLNKLEDDVESIKSGEAKKEESWTKQNDSMNENIGKLATDIETMKTEIAKELRSEIETERNEIMKHFEEVEINQNGNNNRINDIEAKLKIEACDQIEQLTKLNDDLESIKVNQIKKEELVIKQIDHMIEKMDKLASDVETINTETVENLKNEINGKGEEIMKNIEESVEIEVNSNMNTILDIKLARHEGAINQENKAILRIVESIKSEEIGAKHDEELIKQMECMATNIANVARDVQSIKTKTVENLMKAIEEKSDKIRDVENSVAIEVHSLKEEMESLEEQQQNISHAISSQLAEIITNHGGKETGNKENENLKVKEINANLEIKLARQEAAFDQEHKALLRIVENTRRNIADLDENIKLNIESLGGKLQLFENLIEDSEVIMNFNLKQLREKVETKFEKQNKTNKIVLDSVQLVASKISNLTGETELNSETSLHTI